MSKPLPLHKLQEEIDAGQAARLVEGPEHPGYFSLTFLVKYRLGYYWLRVSLDHPKALQHTSTLSGFPDWSELIKSLTDRRAREPMWELAGVELELPASICDFLAKEEPMGAVRGDQAQGGGE